LASIHSDIRAALESKLANIAGIPPIAFDNVPYDPTTGTSFIKSSYIPVTRVPAVRGLNPSQLYKGLYSVTVYCPEGNGPGVADGIANTVIENFEAATDVSLNNFNVSIDYAERQQGFLDTPWYYIPINIGWYIYN
jgi:hypothetical protein|tara:strand:- start:326 stop:733 length:408 start_codon:yes stop_codon:yes gene_type:complete